MKNLIGIVCIVILLSACHQGGKHHREKDREKPSLALQLNDGGKWPVNKETEEGMNNIMSKIFQLENGSLTVREYLGLGEYFSEQVNFIIQKCDMTGEPHNQLHVVLLPIIEKVEELKNVGSIQEGKKAVSDLEGLGHAYREHFTYPGL